MALLSDRLSILSYLEDPELPPRLLETFFVAAIEFADDSPWRRLSPSAHFPILLTFRAPEVSPTGPGGRRLALILGGAESGGDTLGLVLTDGLLSDVPREAGTPTLVVIYESYPDQDISPIMWRGRPIPQTRSGLLPWPTVHDLDDRVRAPRRAEIRLLTAGLLAVRRFLRSYPQKVLEDRGAPPHECDVDVNLPLGGIQVKAALFPVPQ